MKKLIVSLIIIVSSFLVAGTYDVQDTNNSYPMIFRMNYQNSSGGRDGYVNTTHPKMGWVLTTGTGTAPVSTNIANGEAVMYYDSTEDNAGFVGLQKDATGNLTSDLVFKSATITTLTTTTPNLTILGGLTVVTINASGAVEINDDITLENDEVISNAANGVIGLTATTVSTNGSINVDGSAVIDGALSAGAVTLTGLIANVTTSSVTISTGNVNIPVTVNGVLLYIKANTAE